MSAIITKRWINNKNLNYDSLKYSLFNSKESKKRKKCVSNRLMC